MTDEEKLAEEYVKSVIDVNAFDWKIVREIALAFLAGLKAGSQLDKVWQDYDPGEGCYEDSHEGKWVKREAGKPKWHKLSEKYPEADKLVRVRLLSGMEHVCETCYYELTEDEIGYGKLVINFNELNGEWVDDNDIIAWCEIPTYTEE